MNTIIMNTLSEAVTEYDGFNFQSLTPTHAGSALGLYALGGNLDLTAPIVASITTGKTQWGASLKKFVASVYFAIKGSGTSTLTVKGESTSYSYQFPIRPAGESRGVPGRGIRENYLAFGYRNTDGADFQLDKIEVLVAPSQNRRI